jgi:hypothetical protein
MGIFYRGMPGVAGFDGLDTSLPTVSSLLIEGEPNKIGNAHNGFARRRLAPFHA